MAGRHGVAGICPPDASGVLPRRAGDRWAAASSAPGAAGAPDPLRRLGPGQLPSTGVALANSAARGVGYHRSVRSQVFIAPVARVPNGSMIDPRTGRFWASWQDEDVMCSLGDPDFDGAEAAIVWGRERAGEVYILLGHTDDTSFSAGSVHPQGEGAWPIWPPAAPPPGGWWAPPAAPTREDVRAVVAEVARGERSAQAAAAWAFDRWPAFQEGEQEVQAALMELTSGWFYDSGVARPVSEIGSAS